MHWLLACQVRRVVALVVGAARYLSVVDDVLQLVTKHVNVCLLVREVSLDQAVELLHDGEHLVLHEVLLLILQFDLLVGDLVLNVA